MGHSSLETFMGYLHAEILSVCSPLGGGHERFGPHDRLRGGGEFETFPVNPPFARL